MVLDRNVAAAVRERRPDRGEVEPRTVVDDRDPQSVAAKLRADDDVSRRALSQAHPLACRFQSVIDGIPKEVEKRLAERVEDRAIGLDFLPFDHDLDILADARGDIARRARQRLGDVRERAHAQPPHVVHQARRRGAKRARVIVYDTTKVKEHELSTCQALADEKWKKRILIRSSGNIYNQSPVASMIHNDGAEAAEAWCKGIVANMAREPKGGDTDQINALVACEGDIAVSNSYYFARLLSGYDDALKEKLAKVKVFFPNQGDRGTHVNVSGAGVAANAPNKDNAVKFLEFLISPEAQAIFSGANFEYPVRDGAEQAAVIASWGKFKEDKINVVELGKNNAEAVKIMDRAGWA